MALGIKIPKNAFKAGQKSYKEGPKFNDVELEPGKHVAIVIKLRGVETKNGPSVVMDLKAAGESEQAGGRFSIFYGLDEEHIGYLFGDLAKLGYEVEELDDEQLDEIAEDIAKTKPVVRVTAKKKGEYTNVYIDKVLEDVEASDVETDGEADDEEDEDDEKPKKKGKKAKDEEEDEEEEEEDPSGDDDEVELEVGMKVSSANGAWKGEAKIVKIDEKKGLISVKTAKGNIVTAKPDEIEV